MLPCAFRAGKKKHMNVFLRRHLMVHERYGFVMQLFYSFPFQILKKGYKQSLKFIETNVVRKHPAAVG